MEIESILVLYLSAVMPSNIFRTLRSATFLAPATIYKHIPTSGNLDSAGRLQLLRPCSFFFERGQPANIGMEHDKKIGDLKFWAAFLFYALGVSLFLTIYFPAAPSPEIMPSYGTSLTSPLSGRLNRISGK